MNCSGKHTGFGSGAGFYGVTGPRALQSTVSSTLGACASTTCQSGNIRVLRIRKSPQAVSEVAQELQGLRISLPAAMKIRPLPRLPVALRLQPHRNTPPLPLTLDIPTRHLLHHLFKRATLRDHHRSRIPQIIVDTFLAPERPLERPKIPWKSYFPTISLPAKE